MIATMTALAGASVWVIYADIMAMRFKGQVQNWRNRYDAKRLRSGPKATHIEC